ncbi:MAG: 2,3-bisphosphoglycerate-independent phosphoglycerate mutase [Gammaproteobacteria bacterium]|nr:2,3-bisphosphoglycerate-independent phosphoglycerate mutase [Gammaproteobacteria bacterium]
MSVNESDAFRRAILIILDGYGVNSDGENNAVTQANTPRLDKFFSTNPYTTLEASGSAVGLPEGQMGNSEVGHITMGCGNIIHQDLVLINDAIHDGSFFKNAVLLAALTSAKENSRPIHLLGLVSDGGVHSHIEHLKALLAMCKLIGVEPAVHMITDGRDTSPNSALSFLDEIEELIEEANGAVHSVIGRYYAMDRDRRWERTELAWKTLVSDEGLQAASPRDAIKASYENEVFDEFIIPTVIKNTSRIERNDEVIFFNFRNDRPRQLGAALAEQGFEEFERDQFEAINMCTMTLFHSSFCSPVAFTSEHPRVSLAEVVSNMGLRQLHCAETEKYPHVTFFINGGKETPYPGEDRIMVPSPKVATYDLKPEMSAKEVADEVIKSIEDKDHSLIIVNFANGDMVGHTAVRDAIIVALEVMDKEVGRVLDKAIEYEVNVLLTSDHGNCDEMYDALTGEPHTQHTTNPVPCMVIDHKNNNIKLSSGKGLGSVTPTILELMNIAVPGNMEEESLITK